MLENINNKFCIYLPRQESLCCRTYPLSERMNEEYKLNGCRNVCCLVLKETDIYQHNISTILNRHKTTFMLLLTACIVLTLFNALLKQSEQQENR